MLKKVLFIFSLLGAAVFVTHPMTASAAYNYGDSKSATLVSKAWKAFQDNDLEAVLAYTDKCLELYSDPAKKMQEGRKDYPTGTPQEIHAYWALNDVATSLFIKGEALRKAGKMDEAKATFDKLINEFSYGQSWDPSWSGFWKPAEAAKEKLGAMANGSANATAADFSDLKSQALVGKAWKALSEDDYEAVKAYVDKCLELYQDKAREMQKSLTEAPWESPEKIFSYWALNDVGTALFIQAEAYSKAGNTAEAERNYRKVVDEYAYAQCWDPSGMLFWQPSKAAEEKLSAMGVSLSKSN